MAHKIFCCYVRISYEVIPTFTAFSRLRSRFVLASLDYLLGLSNNPSVEPDIQNACNITGLSKKSIDKLKLMKTSSATTYQNGVVKKICPQTVIVDKLLSSTAFWQFTYQLSWLLNETQDKRIHWRNY